MGLTFGFGIWNAAIRPAGGGTTVPGPGPDALTLTEFGQDNLVFDTGAAFDRNAGRVPLSGTASAGAVVQARFVEAGGAAHTGWQDVATADGTGAWEGALQGPRSPEWLRVQARLKAAPAVTAATTRVCALGHVSAVMGQSEIDRVMITGGGAYEGSIADPEQVQVVVGAASFAGNGNPGNNVTGYAISRGFLGQIGAPAPKLTHAADMIRKATTAKVMIVDLALSASGRFQLSDDVSARRRWSDFIDMLDAAGWQEGVRPGVIVDMWTNADNQFATDFIAAYKPFYTGKTADGADYVPGTPYEVETFPGTPGTDDLTIKHDHILFDLTGRGLGLFDAAETRIALCHHRYDPILDLDGALVSTGNIAVTDMWGQEILRETFFGTMPGDSDFAQIMVRGTEPLNYENGTDTSGIWGDVIHPGQGPDGLQLFARHLAHAGLRALKLVPDTVPEFDSASFDSAGAHADFSWSGGPSTTTRKLRGIADLDGSQPHWTDVFGFEFNGRPVERAELQGDGSVRVHVPAGAGSGPGGVADWSKDRFFFGRGGATGFVKEQDDPLNRGWMNYPVIDADAAGVPGLYDDSLVAAGGIAVRPLPSDSVMAPAAYRAAAVATRGVRFTAPQGIRDAAGGVLATQVRAEWRGALLSTQDPVTLFSVGTRFTVLVSRGLQLRVAFWAGGGSQQSDGVALVPRVRADVVVTADLIANSCSVTVDGQSVLTHTINGTRNSFVNTDKLSFLGQPGGQTAAFEFERAAVWINDLAGTGAPYKDLRGSDGPAALNADPWRVGDGTIT